MNQQALNDLVEYAQLHALDLSLLLLLCCWGEEDAAPAPQTDPASQQSLPEHFYPH